MLLYCLFGSGLDGINSWIRMGYVLQQNEETVLDPKYLQSDAGQEIRKM